MSEVKPAYKHTALCEVCEETVDFVAYLTEEPWCKQCGIHPSMLLPHNDPGGCENHPSATHEPGYGLVEGGFGAYSVCNECGIIFNKTEEMDE